MYTMYYSFSNIPFHKELHHDKLFESTSLKEGLARMEHLKENARNRAYRRRSGKR